MVYKTWGGGKKGTGTHIMGGKNSRGWRNKRGTGLN